jgi:hypothetical protein
MMVTCVPHEICTRYYTSTMTLILFGELIMSDEGVMRSRVREGGREWPPAND